MFTGLTIR